MFTVGLVFFLVTIQIVFCTNYCDQNLCRGRQHIACNHTGKFASSCNQSSLIKLSSYEIEQILDLHNSQRNTIASGKGDNGLKSAAAMPILKWNTELASIAEFNVKQCKMAHDKCRNTKEFKFAGQNLGFRANSREFEGISSFINNVIWAWYNEIKFASPSDIAACCGPIDKIGHFLQIIQDQATFVGCAISQYITGRMKNLLFACNYSITNMRSQPVYVTGPPASKCGSRGINSKYTSLCN